MTTRFVRDVTVNRQLLEDMLKLKGERILRWEVDQATDSIKLTVEALTSEAIWDGAGAPPREATDEEFKRWAERVPMPEFDHD